MKQSGGNATIYSEPGRGTTVNLYLPRAVTHAASASKDAAEEAAQAAGETVLVVEDNPELRKLSLRRLALLGYRVIEADSGPSALAVLDGGEEIDLIFSDVIMPGGMTGYELCLTCKKALPVAQGAADFRLRPGGRIDARQDGERVEGAAQALQTS